jgi:predicted nucleic acid-binding protein
VKILVPDASVILKWVMGEERTDEAQVLLDGWLNQEHEFILPSLWMYEVGNVLGLKRPRDADHILSLLLDYHFSECKVTGELVRVTNELMREYRVTFYDAVYHATAILQKGAMVTADRVYYEKTKKRGSVRLV